MGHASLNREAWGGWLGIVLLAAAAAGCSPEENPTLPRNDAAPTDGGMDQGRPPSPDSGPVPVNDGPLELIILHTNDLHDQLMAWGPSADFSPATAGDDTTQGGFSRLAALIQRERAAATGTPVLLLDAGDFLMGSLFSWLGPTEAPALTLMQRMGYDALTLGNHELDWTPDGLAGVLAAAVDRGFSSPLLATNLVFPPGAATNLEAFATAGRIRRKLVKTMANGLKVGIFGLLGEGAAANAPLAGPLTFGDAVATASALVQELRQQDDVDLVICLSHGGVDETGAGEDAALAAAVPGIDVIIGGHTHVALSPPVQVQRP